MTIRRSNLGFLLAIGLGAVTAVAVGAWLARGSLSEPIAVASLAAAGGVLAIALIIVGISMGRGQRFGSSARPTTTRDVTR